MSHPSHDDASMKIKIYFWFLILVAGSAGLGRGEEDLDLLGQPEKPEWQKVWEARKARETREMEDFVGAVYRGNGDFVLVDEGTAVGAGGAIVRAGDTFLTPQGAYVKAGDSYLRPDGGAVVDAGGSFVSWDGTMVRAGDVYVGTRGTSVVAGATILRNFREKPGWGSR